jgi:hypothetical protein
MVGGHIDRPHPGSPVISGSATLDRADIGAGVRRAYRHYQKLITPNAPLQTERYALKWYDIGLIGKVVPPALVAEARDLATGLMTERGLAGEAGAGFVILNECHEVAYLSVAIWRNDNELWERIFARSQGSGGFLPLQDESGWRHHHCVWQLTAICHEHAAWHRFLFGPRDDAGRRQWLGDMCSGLTPELP